MNREREAVSYQEISAQDRLRRQHDAAKRAYDLMMETIIGFDPCATMRIGDAQFLARMTQTYVFNALREGQE